MSSKSIILSLALFSVGSQATELTALQDEQALNPDNIVFLQQNWNDEDRQWFYHVNQGSSLLTYDLFVRLEQHDNRELLREPGQRRADLRGLPYPAYPL